MVKKNLKAYLYVSTEYKNVTNIWTDGQTAPYDGIGCAYA